MQGPVSFRKRLLRMIGARGAHPAAVNTSPWEEEDPECFTWPLPEGPRLAGWPEAKQTLPAHDPARA